MFFTMLFKQAAQQSSVPAVHFSPVPAGTGTLKSPSSGAPLIHNAIYTRKQTYFLFCSTEI